jgi:hypothetical protein
MDTVTKYQSGVIDRLYDLTAYVRKTLGEEPRDRIASFSINPRISGGPCIVKMRLREIEGDDGERVIRGIGPTPFKAFEAFQVEVRLMARAKREAA